MARAAGLIPVGPDLARLVERKSYLRSGWV